MSLEDTLSYFNISIDPRLLQALQLASSNDSSNSTNSSATLVLEASTTLTAVSAAGDLREPDPSALDAVAVLVKINISKRHLSLPLPFPPGNGAASNLCLTDATAAFDSTSTDTSAVALLQAVADAAGVPVGWVTLKCKAPPAQAGQRRLQVGFIGK
jgi:hypothetical protein